MMSRRIPQPFIDELIARTDIVELIGGRVQLKKAGREYKAVCPFHDEKTPSFTVSPSKGFYHCFGCGAHGTAIGFLMNHDNLGFLEAVEELAERLGLDVPTTTADSGGDAGAEEGIYGVLREADQIYRRELRDSVAAIEYLKHRGIDGTTAGRFAIGYAPDSWDTVLKALGGNEAAGARLLEAGLVIRNERGRCYDRFRDRVMFPIRDQRGRVIGFGGRVLGEGEPKYLNSPETAVFHKGRALYGLYEARQLPGRPQEIIVVEGYLDVASLAQHGIEPAVATLGTATTADHVRRLIRLSDRVIFCFDGDRAGRAAAWRALETVLPHAGGRVELKFLLLPQGEDPDSLVRRRGAEGFRALLAQALPLSRFLVQALSQRVDLTSADGRSRLAALAKPLVGRLPLGVYRELVLAELADAVGLPAERLERLLGEPPESQAGMPLAVPDKEGRPSLIRQTIALILHYPAAAARLAGAEGLQTLDKPGADLLARLLEVARRNPQISTAGLLERFRDDPQGRHLGKLAASASLDDAEAAPAVLEDSIARILETHRRERLGVLLGRGSHLSEQEQAELRRLLEGTGDEGPQGSA